MHRLEITGATPEELYVNSLNMLSMLVRGSAALTQPAQVADPDGNPPTGRVPEPRSEPLDDEKTTVLPKPKRGAKAKATEGLNDPVPDLTGAKTIEHEPQKLTLDGDIRPRLRAIQKACEARGNDMPACVAYIMKLYGPFGVQKADQLKPEQFAEFMEASEGFLSGEA